MALEGRTAVLAVFAGPPNGAVLPPRCGTWRNAKRLSGGCSVDICLEETNE